jgi:hypothetical protein
VVKKNLESKQAREEKIKQDWETINTTKTKKQGNALYHEEVKVERMYGLLNKKEKMFLWS